MTRAAPRRSLDAALRIASALLLPGAAQAAADVPAVAFLPAALRAAERLPAPPGCTPPAVDTAGRVRASPLPARIPGEAAGATGGLGRPLLVVRSALDGPERAPPPGSLRAALHAAREDGGWIVFAPALAGATIRLEAGLRLPSRTTLDGGCGGVTLLAPAAATTLLLRDATDVIVSGLAFAKHPYAEPGERIGDAIGLAGDFDRVAILHNAFARCGDGCVDIVRRDASAAPGRVSVAFNRFADHNKAMLVGSLACAEGRALPACAEPLRHLSGTLRPTIRLSLAGNVFLGTSQRHPKAVATAFVHSANNLVVLAPTRYADGRMSAVYGGVAASGGILVSEGDIVVNPGAGERLSAGPVSAQSEAGRAREADGAVAVLRQAAVGELRVRETAREVALAELAPAARVPASDPRGDTLAAAACLLRHAGPAGAGGAGPAACLAAQSAADRTATASSQDQSARARAAVRH